MSILVSACYAYYGYVASASSNKMIHIHVSFPGLFNLSSFISLSTFTHCYPFSGLANGHDEFINNAIKNNYRGELGLASPSLKTMGQPAFGDGFHCARD
jgi:hypothetical protein